LNVDALPRRASRKPLPSTTRVEDLARRLRGPLRYLSLLGWLVPRVIRDWLYYQLSKRRKAWFGEASQCRLWDDHWDERFVGEVSGVAAA